MMLHRIVLCVVGLVLLLSLCSAELVVRKTITNTEILSSRAVVVKINIFNTGKTYVPLPPSTPKVASNFPFDRSRPPPPTSIWFTNFGSRSLVQ
jgi:hypothetical protein